MRHDATAFAALMSSTFRLLPILQSYDLPFAALVRTVIVHCQALSSPLSTAAEHAHDPVPSAC